MNRKLTFALFSAAALSSSLALAQITPPAPPPSPDALPAPRAPRGQRAPEVRVERDVRVITMDGNRSNSRIAPPGLWWKNPDIIQKLTLTADQQKRMNDIFQQSRLQLIDLKANVEKQEVTLEPMLDANPPDTNKVLAQIDRTAQARAELEKANAKMLLGIRGVLTSDHWTKLQSEQRMNHRIMIRHEGPGGPEGPLGPEGMLEFHTAPGANQEFNFQFSPRPDSDLPPLPPTE